MGNDKTADLRRRTKSFALRVIKQCQRLGHTREARIIGDQLLRSGTGVAVNYRAACRTRSRAEFIAKLGIVVEEADETVFWCELLDESGIVTSEAMADLVREARELLSIFAMSQRTARSRRVGTRDGQLTRSPNHQI